MTRFCCFYFINVSVLCLFFFSSLLVTQFAPTSSLPSITTKTMMSFLLPILPKSFLRFISWSKVPFWDKGSQYQQGKRTPSGSLKIFYFESSIVLLSVLEMVYKVFYNLTHLYFCCLMSQISSDSLGGMFLHIHMVNHCMFFTVVNLENHCLWYVSLLCTQQSFSGGSLMGLWQCLNLLLSYVCLSLTMQFPLICFPSEL